MRVRILVLISMLFGIPDSISGADEKRELLLPLGHSGYIKSVAFTPDGKSVFTGSVDGSVRLWDVGTGKTIRVFQRPPEQYSPVAYARDGKHFLVKSVDSKGRRIVEFVEAATGKTIRTIYPNQYDLYLLVLSDDGKRAIAGDLEVLKVFDTDSGELLKTFEGKSCGSAVFSPDGKSFLSGARNWDIESGEAAWELKDANAVVVAFSPDGKNVLTNGRGSTVRLWDVATKKEIQKFDGHSWVNSMGFSPDEKRIVTGDSDYKARIFDVASGKLLYTFKGHNGWVNAVAFSPDGKSILTGSEDRTARLWDIATGTVTQSFQQANLIGSLALSPDGRELLVGCTDSTIRWWDFRLGNLLPPLQEQAYPAVYFPDGGRILSATGPFDLATQKEIPPFRNRQDLKNQLMSSTGISLSPDGRRVLSGCGGNLVYIGDVAQSRTVRTLKGHAGMIRAVAYGPDGNTVLSGSEDGTARLWNPFSGQTLRVFKGHKGDVYSVAYCLDRKRILTGSSDGTARLWDIATGRSIRSFEGHAGAVTCVCLSPDGKSVLTGSSGGTAELWDIATGDAVRSFRRHAAGVSAVLFARHGKAVVTGSLDGTVRVWNAETGKEVFGFISAAKEWLAWTPEGYYSTSYAGEKLIAWKIADVKDPRGYRIETPDLLAEKFHRYDLFSHLFAELDLEKALTTANKAAK